MELLLFYGADVDGDSPPHATVDVAAVHGDVLNHGGHVVFMDVEAASINPDGRLSGERRSLVLFPGDVLLVW